MGIIYQDVSPGGWTFFALNVHLTDIHVLYTVVSLLPLASTEGTGEACAERLFLLDFPEGIFHPYLCLMSSMPGTISR